MPGTDDHDKIVDALFTPTNSGGVNHGNGEYGKVGETSFFMRFIFNVGQSVVSAQYGSRLRPDRGLAKRKLGKSQNLIDAPSRGDVNVNRKRHLESKS